MARAASKAKKGYYKTPTHLIPLIAQYLDARWPDKARVLDPCCGTGEALALLGDALGLERTQLYGNELDEVRFRECGQYGINAVCGDANYELETPLYAYSLMYLNPPYDDEGDGEGRTEAKFLGRCLGFVRRNGIVILVVPLDVLARKELYERIPYILKDVRVFRFPEEDYEAFRQVVLIGRASRGKSKTDVEQFQTEAQGFRTLGDDLDERFIVPDGRNISPFPFYSRNLLQDQIDAMMQNRVVKRMLWQGLPVADDMKVQTLMPLRSGHQALMLASGMMDGAYKDPETGNLLVISGKTERKKSEKETTDGDTTIKTIRYTPTPIVKALNVTASVEGNGLQMINFE